MECHLIFIIYLLKMECHLKVRLYIDRANDSLSSLDAQIEMVNYEKARLNEWVDGNLELERLQKIPIHFEFQEALKQSSKVANELTSI
ncbi:hypothetical protein Tco_0361822 [Tanacetum coccineum]